MLITNATLITWEEENRVLEDYALYLEDGLIEDIGPRTELEARYPDADRLDAAGQYVLPGNICAHTHFYGAYRARIGDPRSGPQRFP